MTEMTEDPASARPARRGQASTVEEEHQLFDEFRAGYSIDSMALGHQRSPGGIHARLQRLGLINKDGEPVDPLPPFAPPKRRTHREEKAAPQPMRAVFEATTSNGWHVEVRSNRSLDKTMVERLALMLRGALADGDEVPF